MSSSGDASQKIPVRRPPPPFRRVQVRHTEELSPRLRRVVLGGEDLNGFELDEPAASVRLLLPPPDANSLVMPEWTGNEFVLPSGDRAPIRTFTPRRFDSDELELTLDMVLHHRGLASDWAREATAGDEVAVSGPGRGWPVALGVESYVLAGDETAIPAIAQLVEAIPATASIDVHVEVVEASSRIDLPDHRSATVNWHVLPDDAASGDALVEALLGLDDVPERIWVAGEAASMQKIRKDLFEERGLPRSHATVRGYWKQGRSAT